MPSSQRSERQDLSTALDEMVSTIVDVAHPEQIILFGSHADGHPTADSDIDLLIVAETDASFFHRSVPIREALGRRLVPLDLLVYTPSEFNTWKDVVGHIVETAVRTGTILYERGS